MEEKKDNNNNLQHSHNFSNIVTTFEDEQKTLFGDVKIKPKFKLNDNQFKLLSLFALNDLTKFTRNNLFYVTSKPIHINTISNFLKDSESKGFIKRQRIIPGATINNLFMFQKLPDTFEDGLICKDIRAIYYSVTKLGIEVFNLNEKMRLL